MHHIQREHRVEEAREALKTSLVELGPILADKPYFLSERIFFTRLCIRASIMASATELGVTIPGLREGLSDYMQRLFQRDTFSSGV